MEKKLLRLSMLEKTLIEYMKKAKKDSEEQQFYSNIQTLITQKLTEEKRKAGWWGVYPIIDEGFSGPALYEGTPESCRNYRDKLLKDFPEKKGDIIILAI